MAMLNNHPAIGWLGYTHGLETSKYLPHQVAAPPAPLPAAASNSPFDRFLVMRIPPKIILVVMDDHDWVLQLMILGMPHFRKPPYNNI